MRNSLIISALVATVVASCAPTTQLSVTPIALSPDLDRQARALTSYDLLDPGSAQFRNLRAWQLSNGDIAVCGEQNGRNRLGGSVGFQPLYVRFTPGASPIRRSLHRELLAQSACGALRSGRSIPVAAG
jgi:hypothetical protein